MGLKTNIPVHRLAVWPVKRVVYFHLLIAALGDRLEVVRCTYSCIFFTMLLALVDP